MQVEEFREKIKRKAIMMDIGGFRPPENPMTSWFGDVKYSLSGEEWPLQNGKPMHALAQINLMEFPFRPTILSEIEFLTVFIGPSELPVDTVNGENWCLRTYNTTDSLVPLAGVDTNSSIRKFPMCPRIIEDYPCSEDIPCECPEEIEDNYYDHFENVGGFKFGGWPTLIQSEIWWAPGNLHPSSPEYAFQIDTTEKGNWMWGDNGVGYFGRGTTEGHENDWAVSWQCY